MGAFLNRQIEGDWPYLWIDATYVKTREAGRIVSVAVIVAVGVNTDGQREVLGLKVGARGEAELDGSGGVWEAGRGGAGRETVHSDKRGGGRGPFGSGLLAALRVGHFRAQRLAGHAGKTQRRMVSAAIGTVFVQETADAARAQWRTVADQLRAKFPQLGLLMDDQDVATMGRIGRDSAPIRWSARERRTNVVGIFPNDASIVRLVGAMILAAAAAGPLASLVRGGASVRNSA